MITKFEDGKTYIFDMSTFLKDNYDKLNTSWAQQCNQKTVSIIDETNGFILINEAVFIIKPRWCKEKEYKDKKIDINNFEEGEF